MFDISSTATNALMIVTAHPFAYAKTLIQLGHEPLAPQLGNDVFFRKKFFYPGVFHYIGHVKQVDGVLGLYRGVVPRIFANFTMTHAYNSMKNVVSTKKPKSFMTIEEEEDFRQVCIKLSEETIARCTGVIASQPFHVIAIRSMAYFIGREAAYASPLSCISEIYKQEGILGFFSGLMPRIVFEVAAIWIAGLITLAFNTYIINEKSELRDARPYVPIASSYISQSFLYPLSVTTTMMACNGAQMAAGSPPYTPVYANWMACLGDLRTKGLSTRGSSMLFRPVIASKPKLIVPVETPLTEAALTQEVLPLPSIE